MPKHERLYKCSILQWCDMPKHNKFTQSTLLQWYVTPNHNYTFKQMLYIKMV